MSNETEGQIAAWLSGQGDAMVALLEEVVNVDSGSYDKAGVDAVGTSFERFFAGEGITDTMKLAQRAGADHIGTDLHLWKRLG